VAFVHLFMCAMLYNLKHDSIVRLCSKCGDMGVNVVMLCVDLMCLADACAGTSFTKCDIPWKGADRLLRIHSTMDEHYFGRSGPHRPRALEILELG